MKINSQVIKQLVGKSLFYPSGDNAQPFRFSIQNQERVVVSYLEEKARHPLNEQCIASWMALGHFIEILSLHAQSVGLDLEIKIKEQKQDSAWVEIFFKEGVQPLNKQRKFIHEHLDLRTTDRRPYLKKSQLSQVDIEELKKLIEVSVELEFLNPVVQDWVVHLLKVEELAWKWSELALSTFKWVTLKPMKEGMPWKNLNVPFWMVPSLFAFKKFPAFYRLSSAFGATKINKQILAHQLSHTLALGFWKIKSPQPQNYIALGRSNLRVWTWLNAHGFGYQPMTLGVLPSYILGQGYILESWPSPLVTLLKETKKLLGRWIENPQQVIWSFRTGGIDHPLPQNQRTLRLFEDEVIEILD
ncbi:MAG: hypothetical protein K1X29_09175 [Bdellovibrionales bacterium]|nr:hypothetical protein [Bdellovibrionales bacterium]